MTYTNKQIKTMLTENICEVTFTKVDGSVRVMPCTLNSAHIPPAPIKEDKKPKKVNPEVVSAYCIDKQEWRSFRVANVTDIKILND